jgi:drug/metabolite transporter (DMT)-like permease
MPLRARLLSDQFISVPATTGGRRRPWEQYASVVLGLIGAALVALRGCGTDATGALLSATSILTGLIFTMAMRFWERSIDIRDDPNAFLNPERVGTIDRMRSQLIWTVLCGIVSTSWLAGMALTTGNAVSTVWAAAVAAGLIVYQLAQVGVALLSLYAASYTLRK